MPQIERVKILLDTQPNKQLMFAARVHVDKSIKSDGLSRLF